MVGLGSSSHEVMASLVDVSKIYANGSCGLDRVNLTIYKGDFLFVTGASGAGKSTLLKMLYGAEKPTTGTVEVQGTIVNSLTGAKLAHLRRRMGVVFQDYQLIPKRTVEENIAVVLKAQGFDRAEVRKRIAPTLQMVGLASKEKCFPEELSGGEQQRVSIARAIVHEPPLLLADEPTGNLDVHNAWMILQILKKLNHLGVTVVVTCHNEQLIKTFAKRVVRVEAGIMRELTPAL
ncbi:MAG: cell division ATP-binding protein FtsE [Anaerolineae bacterium]|nr:cell division ATP-binding protein FtsE [Gloeobacterales cyanobacterium ES-bin-313]